MFDLPETPIEPKLLAIKKMAYAIFFIALLEQGA
jgi:hypothetical protein